MKKTIYLIFLCITITSCLVGKTYEMTKDDVISVWSKVNAKNVTVNRIGANTLIPSIVDQLGIKLNHVVADWYEVEAAKGLVIGTQDKMTISHITIDSAFSALHYRIGVFFRIRSLDEVKNFLNITVGYPDEVIDTSVPGVKIGSAFHYYNGIVFEYIHPEGKNPESTISIFPEKALTAWEKWDRYEEKAAKMKESKRKREEEAAAKKKAEYRRNIKKFAKYNVQYRITGTAYAVSVTIRNNHGGTEQGDYRLPYFYGFYASPGQFIYLSAQNLDSYGSVTVEIYKDGVLYKKATSRHGGYKIATVSGNY